MFNNSLLNVAVNELSPKAQAEVKAAVATRGKRRGFIKKRPPKFGSKGYMAWQAIMANIAPSRVSIYGMLMSTPESRKLFDEIDAWATKYRRALNQSAQKPLEFNLYHFNN